MSKKSMEILIAELAAELELPDLAMDEQDYVCVQTDNGVLINMDYFEDADVLSFYTTIGEIPQKQRTEILQALLEANFAWTDTGGATLCLDPDGNLALLTVAMSIEGMDLPLLRERMRDFTQLAWNWSDRIRELSGEPSLQPASQSDDPS